MVNKAFKKGKDILFNTQNTIISAAFVIAVLYGVSAVLGLFKSRLLAHYFGTSEELAVFYTADKLPGMVYVLLVVGTLSTVFIPVFTERLKKDAEKAWHTASTMITLTVLLFLAAFAVIFLFAEVLISLLALGQFTPEQVELGASLMRLMLAAQLILVVSSFLTSILQSFKYFLMPALAPVFYNLGMILGIVILTERFGIYGPTYGVVIGSLLHLLIQLPIIPKVNFKYDFSLDFSDKGFKSILTLMPPRVLGAGVSQLSGIVNNSLAILIATSSVVTFKFAMQLQNFPVLLFGSSLAQAALPTLSYESADTNDISTFKETFLTTFHQMLFLVIPSSLILLVLRVPIVRLVYGSPNLSWEATLETAMILGFFSLSIFAQSTLFLVNRAFFALKDTVTPVLVSIVTLLISVILSLVFIYYFEYGVWSVAFSYSITSILNLVWLMYLLDKKVGGFGFMRIVTPFYKISISAILMSFSLYIPMKVLDFRFLDTSRTINLIILSAVASFAGLAVYLFFTWIFKVDEIELFYKLLRRLNIKKAKERSTSTGILE